MVVAKGRWNDLLQTNTNSWRNEEDKSFLPLQALSHLLASSVLGLRNCCEWLEVKAKCQHIRGYWGLGAIQFLVLTRKYWIRWRGVPGTFNSPIQTSGRDPTGGEAGENISALDALF